MKLFVVALFFGFALSSCVKPTAQALCTDVNERAILNSIYANNGGAGWVSTFGWSNSANQDTNGLFTSDPCLNNWQGIFCSSDGVALRVTTIDLSGQRVTGNLPSFDAFTRLRYLWLSDNPGITGPLPTLTGLFQIQQILFANDPATRSGITGGIPTNYALFTQLTKLYLTGNGLTEQIPTNLGNLANLYDLQLQDNLITGTIPTEFGRLSKLATLRLQGNNLQGQLPSELGNARSLIELDVSSNPLLGGIIPVEIGNIPRIALFYFDNCNFQCIFPEFLGNLSRGIVFDARGNEFFCPTPDTLSSQIGNSLDPCVSFDMQTQTVNGDSTIISCVKNDGSPCLIGVSGNNLKIGTCNVVLTVESYVNSLPVFDREVPLNPTTYTNTYAAAEIGGPTSSSVLAAITAGPKLLSYQVKRGFQNYWRIGGGIRQTFISIGQCSTSCGSYGTCNVISESCDCFPGFYGDTCQYDCTEPYVNITSGIECNGHGQCSRDTSTGIVSCTCDTCDCSSPLGCYQGEYCNITSCDCVDCNEASGAGFCSNGKCFCNAPFINDPNCDPFVLVSAGATRCTGCTAFTLPDCFADGWTGEYNVSLGVEVSCVCNEDYQGVLCDKEIPEQWPIILGCVLGGVVLIALGIFFFLKFKKFDPEKKRKEMEMKALNG